MSVLLQSDVSAKLRNVLFIHAVSNQGLLSLLSLQYHTHIRSRPYVFPSSPSSSISIFSARGGRVAPCFLGHSDLRRADRHCVIVYFPSIVDGNC
jgi:hypothetical protein